MGRPSSSTLVVRRRILRCAGLVLAAAVGLLIWARLKLVTETPRMVYADPPVKAPSGAGAPRAEGSTR